MSEEQVGSSNRGVAMSGSNNTHGRNRKTIEKKKQLTNDKLKLQALQNKAKKTKLKRRNNIKQLRRLKESLTKEKTKVLRA